MIYCVRSLSDFKEILPLPSEKYGYIDLSNNLTDLFDISQKYLHMCGARKLCKDKTQVIPFSGPL